MHIPSRQASSPMIQAPVGRIIATVAKRKVDRPRRRGQGAFRRAVLLAALIACDGVVYGQTSSAGARHAIAMHGEPALAEGFAQLNYVNPAAPKGGRLVHGALGTFDSLNPFIV